MFDVGACAFYFYGFGISQISRPSLEERSEACLEMSVPGRVTFARGVYLLFGECVEFEDEGACGRVI